MIWEITDLPDIDPDHLEEIKEALKEASLRINTMIQIAFPRSEPVTMNEEAEAEV
jgi:hypothetical protein